MHHVQVSVSHVECFLTCKLHVVDATTTYVCISVKQLCVSRVVKNRFTSIHLDAHHIHEEFSVNLSRTHYGSIVSLHTCKLV